MAEIRTELTDWLFRHPDLWPDADEANTQVRLQVGKWEVELFTHGPSGQRYVYITTYSTSGPFDSPYFQYRTYHAVAGRKRRMRGPKDLPTIPQFLAARLKQ